MSDSVLDILGIESRVSLRPETGPVLKPLEGEADAGKYQLQGEIARGGVGAVVKGYDTHLGRDVAVKLLHEDYLGNPDLLQRFVEEAQIGGQLQHPGIVPVYDLGLQGDRPFFSMKLVKGRTLSALLEEKANKRRLLAIFEQVCHTMAYAHTRAVIHRDLKPANVMVGAFGEVQVVDWGMGKVLGKGGIADETRAQLSVIATVRSEKPGSQSIVGSVMGTPAYMPPEQAMGDVERMDERSDVFSLGAVLCEILTGFPPYVGENLIQQAAKADLTKCRERIDACDADEELKQLVRQCLSPAHQARPKDANELADRIGRHLTTVEERARQAQVEAAEEHVRAQEARRAQKLTLGLAASVLLTLAVGGGGWWWLSTDRAQRQAKASEAAQAALDDARVAYGRADWEAAHADAKRAHVLANDASPGVRQDVATFLADVERRHEKAVDRAKRLENELKMLAVLEGIPIPPDDTAGQTVNPYGKRESARRDKAYRKAFAEFDMPIEDLTVEQAARRIRTMTQPELWAAALDTWAWAALVLHGRGKLRTHLLEIAKRADPDPQRVELRELRERENLKPDDLSHFDVSEFPPMTAFMFATMLASGGAMDRAVAVLRTAQSRHPDSFLLALTLAGYLHNDFQVEEALRFASVASALRPQSTSAAFVKGATLRWMHRYPEAESALRRAIHNGPTHAGAWHQLGHVLDARGRRDDALKAFRRAVEVDPDDPGACSCLGSALGQRGKLEQAEEMTRRATQLEPAQAWWLNNHANALRSLRRFEEAEAALRKAIAIDGTHLLARANLAQLLVKQNRREEARAVCEEALAVDPKQLDAQAAPGLVNVGVVLSSLRQYERGIVAYDRALELDPSDSEARRNAKRNLAVAYTRIANAHIDRREFEEAEAALRKAISIDGTHLNARANLARLRVMQNRKEEARDVCEAALAVDPKQLDARAAPGLVNVGAVLCDELHQYERGIVAYDRALELDPNVAYARRNLAGTYANIARAHMARREFEGAETALRKAISHDGTLMMARADLAQLLVMQNRRKEARAVCKEALAVDPKQLDAQAAPGLVNVGVVLHDSLRQYERAVVAFDRALELDPSDSLARRNARRNLALAHGHIASAHIARGRFGEAAQALRKGIVAHPTARAHGALAWILSNPFERFDEAILEARKALALDPASPHAKPILDAAYVKLSAKLAALNRKVDTDPTAVARTLEGWKRDPGPGLTDRQTSFWAEVDALLRRAEATAR